MKYNQAGQATLKLDIYNMEGDEFKPVPNWHCYMSGDMDSEDGLQELDLPASTFPIGTKIIIQFPLCPDCDMEQELCEDEEGCDFDWKSHWENEFS